MLRRPFLLAVAVTAGLVLASCGSSEPGTGSTETTGVAEDFNGFDVMFAQMMIPHHEQAIEMSDIALDPAVGAGADVRSLAEIIKAGQDPEIVLMTELLGAWGRPVVPTDMMDHGSMMEGMLSVEELDALAMLSGAEFDRRWLEHMIAHHEGAVSMAEDVLARGVNTRMRDLARSIVAAQQTEIAEMRALLGQ